jgi:RHS repeat-associated protein
MNRHQFASRIYSIVFPVLLVGFIFLPSGFAQTEHTKYDKDKTLRGNARVNPSTLAMEFSLPIAGLTGRADNSLALSLEYSSKVWGTDGDTFFNGAGIRTNVTAIFAERSSGGWNSTLDVPRLSLTSTENGTDTGSETELYKTDGTSWKPSDDGSLPPQNFPLVYVSRIRVMMPSGSTAELRLDDSAGHSHGSAFSPSVTKSGIYQGTYLSTDGSKMRLELSWSNDELRSVLYLPDGSRYFDLPGEYAIARQTIYIDRHGNRMSYNSGTRLWTDTLGRSIKNPLLSDLYSEPAEGTETFTYPGLGTGTQQYQMVWQKLETQHSALAYLSPSYCLGTYIYQVPNGSTTLFETNGTTTRFCGSNVIFNPVVLTEVRLADGTAYKFKYNLYGEIEKIEYPTGGYERFEYGYLPPISSTAGAAYDQLNRGVKKRWLSYDGTNEQEPWKYSVVKETTPTQTGPYRVKTIAPDDTWTEQLLKDRYSAVSAPFGFDDASIGRSYEDRAYSSTNQLLKRHLTQWTQTGALTINGVAGHYKATRDPRPEKEISIIFEPGNDYALAQMSETVYETPGQNGAPTDPAYFAALNAKQTKTYHYIKLPTTNAANWTIDQIIPLFLSSDLAVVTETDYLYDANYQARNINGLVSETRVKDASGAVKAKSQIVYDQANYLENTSITNAPGWENPISSVRGLPTTIRSWSDVTNNQYVETHALYDQFGNVRKTWDGRGNYSEIQYTDNYTDAVNRSSYALPTKTISYSGANGTGTIFETTVEYDFNTALPISSTDANGQTTVMEYDAVLRPKKVTAPNGQQTITEYGTPGTNGQLPANQRFVKVRTQIDATNWKEGYTWFDGLARMFKSQSVASDGDVFVETEYDDFGRPWKTSNPYRANETVYKTESFYDTAGRIYKVKTADGAEVETFYSLATTGANIGRVVTVEDQANKPRRSITNALGQLTRVDEPNDSNQLGTVDAPNQPTYYVYDTLGSLMTVKQGGTFENPAQTRSFVYDSLSRLKSATNPESGLIQYTYDANGNLQTKRDARNIKTVYDYDALNRVIQRCYRVLAGSSSPLGLTTCANNSETTEPNTPDVTYYYDGTYYDAQDAPQTATGAVKGKPTSVKSSVSRTNYMAFDVMGRVTQSQQITGDTIPDPMTYTYNLSGALVEQKYPSGRVVKNVLDDNGELSVIQSKKNQNAGFWNYAQHFTYTSSGVVSSMQLGNGRWESTQFNNRLQPTQIALGSTQDATDKLKLNFSYSTTSSSNDNNGNVLSQTITVPSETRNDITYDGFTATQVYSYDSLNRLKQVAETIPNQTGWQQTFTYDRFGNRRFDELNTTASNTFIKNCVNGNNQAIICPNDVLLVNPITATANNRLSGYNYDAAGNLTKDVQNRKFTYDAENKQTKVETVDANNNLVSTVGEYFYDGEGKRVKKIANNGTIIFVYDMEGKLVAEYSSQTNSNPQMYYLTQDNLGSSRINTDANGRVKARHDYQPFGEEIVRISYGADNVTKKFTSKDRDPETSLDNFGARYYSSRYGRFMIPDYVESATSSKKPSPLPYSSLSNPQSLNQFTYVLNNPLNLVDIDGHNPRKPVPGVRGYTYRADRSNMNDSPNIHIFDRRGREVGRFALKGTPEKPIPEWVEYLSGVPNNVKTSIENLVKANNWQPRPPLQTPSQEAPAAAEETVPRSSRRSGRGGRGGGVVGGVFLGLSYLDLFVTFYHQMSDSDQYGYYVDLMGVFQITDLNKAVRYLPTDRMYEFGNGVYVVKDGKLVNVKDKDCSLTTHENGNIIEVCRA